MNLADNSSGKIEMTGLAVNPVQDVRATKKKRPSRGFLGFKKTIPWELMEKREIHINESRIDYPDNRISTSKYNAVNFLPKNLFFQFSKLANIYFVIVGCLQFIKQISTSGGIPYIFIPLSVIVVISAIKDLVEDLKRHKSDDEENNKKTRVLQDGQFVELLWKDLRVGNVVQVLENEYFPADMLLLKSSGKKGICYIETKNLDGETNLKQKIAHKEISDEFADDRALFSSSNQFNYDSPNPYLYTFKGSYATERSQISLNEQNFVLRGCSLRNTHNIYGLISYTGHDTKIMLNSIKSKPKASQLEIQMNHQIILVFLVQFIFCTFSGFYNAIWYSDCWEQVYQYLDINLSGTTDNTFAYNLFVRLGNWLLLFTNFVPISLLVTLEIVKVFQGILMSLDKRCCSLETNTFISVQSSNLNEELGQVEYVFSDKTGTLTCNKMEFKNVSIGGVAYGDDRSYTEPIEKMENVDFLDQSFFDTLRDQNAQNNSNIIDCLMGLAVCHTIITEEKGGKIIYNASSPDELALVNFARYVGFEFLGMDDNNSMEVGFNGDIYKFKLLHVLEFNSDRKRMSVIVQNPQGQYILYCKGADSKILERLSKKNNDSAVIKETQRQLDHYATIGLRTLLVAKKIIDPQTFTNWVSRYHQAMNVIEGREKLVEDLQEEIEVDLTMIGATAIEDKLQDDVGLTIKKLKEAGIKVWVLTGDKVETAINIGYSCQLLSDELKKIEITEEEESKVSEKIEDSLREIEGKTLENSHYALIISGSALTHAMKVEYSSKVMQIASVCRAVLACRVSPKQKQEIVSLVRRERPNVVTLAIGDGANDVNMITAAHVGIGIKGVEGQQAARASDYSIGEFKFLHRLLFYYGRECYRRNSYLVLYNFYKNLAIVLPQFWFAFVDGFSGQTLYDQLIFQFYNVIFTSVPIIVYAVFDEERPDHELLSKAYYYVQGMKNELFNTGTFWKWFFNGCWQAVIFSWISFGSLDYTATSNGNHGRMIGFWDIGMMVLTGVVLVVNIKVLLFSNTFYFLNLFFLIGSFLIFIVCLAIDSVVFLPSISDNYYGEFANVWSLPNFYYGLVVIVVATSFIDWANMNYHSLVMEAKNRMANADDIELQTLIAQKMDHSPIPQDEEHRSHIIGESGDTDNLELSKNFKKPSQRNLVN